MDEFNWNHDGVLSPEEAFLAFQRLNDEDDMDEEEEDDLSWREHRPDAMGFTIGGGDFHQDLYLPEEDEEDEEDYAWRKSCWPDPYGIILPQNYETLAAYEEDLNASIESILSGETEI